MLKNINDYSNALVQKDKKKASKYFNNIIELNNFISSCNTSMKYINNNK